MAAPTKIKLKVPVSVARVVHPDAPRDAKLSAARGALPLPPGEALLALLFLVHGKDAELKTLAQATLADLPASMVAAVAADPETHPQLLDLIARSRSGDTEVVRALLDNPAIDDPSLAFLAANTAGESLALFSSRIDLLIDRPELIAILEQNPQADPKLLQLLQGGEDSDAGNSDEEFVDRFDEDDEGEPSGEIEEVEAEHLSKYQQALELNVADKIKIALTGDKEWRTIFLKDANKLVSSAVLKNPRITEGEVLMVAKNRSASDELIRLINLNREWVKNYEIRRALIMHPKTPLPKALRYMGTLGEKDIKNLAKSRNVSQVLVNNARRIMMAKEKKK